MVEFEIEISTSNPSKDSQTCNLQGKYSATGNPEGERIRNHYHSMRKRIRSERCGSGNPGSLVADYSNVATDRIYDGRDSLNLEDHYQPDNICQGEHILDCYGHTKISNDDEQNINSSATCVSSIYCAFNSEYIGSFEDEGVNGTIDKDYLYDSEENISLESVDKTLPSNETLGENLTSLHVPKDIHDGMPLQPLLIKDTFHKDVTDAKPLFSSPFKSENHYVVEKINSSGLHVPGLRVSVHQSGCSSTIAGLPLLQTSTHIPTQGMLRDKYHANISKPGCSRLPTETKLGDGTSDVGSKYQSLIPESNLIDLSDAFMESADDEGTLFIDIGKNDIGGTSCINGLSSILLSCPSSTHKNGPSNLSEPKETNKLGATVEVPDEAHSEACNKESYQIGSLYRNDQTECASVENMAAASSKVSHSVEHLEIPLICALNTEDPDIPCNNNVILTNQKLMLFSSSTKLLSSDGKCPLGDLIKEEQVPNVQPIVSLTTTVTSRVPGVGLLHSSNGCELEAKSLESAIIAGVSRDVGIDATVNTSCNLQSMTFQSVAGALLKKENTTNNLEKHYKFDSSVNPSLEEAPPGHDHAKFHASRSTADGCKSEYDIQGTLECGPPNSKLVLSNLDVSQSIPATSTSNQQLRFSDGEDDVANFSDVEALILDMDIDGYDRESCLSTKGVSLSQQPVHSKKCIMTLEQGAHAYMNRKISSRGSFAVLYGHRIKYFIKKSEVSLGRGTDDIKVDIDLRDEGYANAISRHQAIIKMEDDGSFLLKNYGRCSIFVNKKEVAARKDIVLSSGSSIKIRDLKFIFVVNQSVVRHYIDTARGASKRPTTEFDWLPGQNP